MQTRFPPLSTLRSFEAVVRLGSVSKAAEELGRTHGAVSKQLAALHAHLGFRLFDKVGTGLRPTASGRALAAAVSKALDDLSDSYAEVVRDARSPVVRVACSATFAMRWLVPHMGGFAQRHPDIRLQLSMTSAREMRDERDADLVILWDRSAYPAEDRERAIRLADTAFGPVATPDYPVARLAEGRLTAPCRIAHDYTSRAWDRWSEATGIRLESARTLTFPHTHLCIEAAVNGLGVALVEQRLVAQELADGRLAALAGVTPFEEGFAALPRRGRPMTTQALQFLDWLAAELQAGATLGRKAAG